MTETLQLARTVNAEMRRATSRDYRIKFDQLDPESLREMLRFLRDIDHEKRLAVRRAQTQPWRR
jgi:DNA-directed RNA polymerase subunit F